METKTSHIPISTQIEKLKAPMKVRSKMCALNQMAKSVGTGNGYLMPSLFVVSDGNEAESIAKLYSYIFQDNKLYGVSGEKNYLNLTFPMDGKELLYERFFESPYIVACTTNKFYGVFLVDLHEWKSGYGIAADNYFMRLLSFIEKNRENITFVFSVSQAFKGMDQLINTLKKKLNLEIFTDMTMEPEEYVDYVVSQLEEQGLSVTNGAREILQERIVCLNVKYGKLDSNSLDLIARNIFLHSKVSADCRHLSKLRLGCKLLNDISCKVFGEGEEYILNHNIGFVK